MRILKYVVIAEDGFGSLEGEAAAVVDTLDEAKGFVADPPEVWRGHVRWPHGLHDSQTVTGQSRPRPPWRATLAASPRRRIATSV